MIGASVFSAALHAGAAGPQATLAFAAEPQSPVYPRLTTSGGGYGKGRGSVAVNVSATSTTQLWARTRSAGDGTTIVQAPFQVSSAFSGGPITITGIDAPDVVANPAHGRIYLDVAPLQTGPWTQGTAAFEIARFVYALGQSQLARFFRRVTASDTIASEGLDSSISQYGHIRLVNPDAPSVPATIDTASVNAMSWQLPATGGSYDGVGGVEFLRKMVARFGVSCAVIGCVQGATPVTAWAPGGSLYQASLDVLTSSGGCFEASLFFQGGDDAIYCSYPPAYIEAVDAIMTYLAENNARGNNFKKYFTVLMNRWDSADQPEFFVRLRKAMETYAASVGGVHVPFNDIDTIDGAHEKNTLAAGGGRQARHYIRAMGVEVGQPDDKGPALLSAVRTAPTTVQFTFSDVGQSTLVLSGPAPEECIHIFSKGYRDQAHIPDQNRFKLVPGSLSVDSKTQLTGTLAQDPGGPHELEAFVYWHNENVKDGSLNNIRDDRDPEGYGYGRHLYPNSVAVPIAAFAGTGTIYQPPGGLIANPSIWDMTPTGAAFTASPWGYSFSAGSAISPTYEANVPNPMFAAYTVEMRFKFKAVPSASETIYKYGSEVFSIANVGGVAKLSVGGATTGSPTLVAGHTYHWIIQKGALGSQYWLADIDAGTAVQYFYSATPFVKYISNYFNWSIRTNAGTNNMSAATADVDEVALFYGTKYSTANLTASGSSVFTPPALGYTRSSPNIVALYNFDGQSISELVNQVYGPTLSVPPTTLLTGNPTISGTPAVGQLQICSQGSWTPTSPAITYSYQWYRGTGAAYSAGTYTAIAGATSSTYTPVSGDSGLRLVCGVTATNSVGSTTAFSIPTTSLSAGIDWTVLDNFSGTDGTNVASHTADTGQAWAGWNNTSRRFALLGGKAYPSQGNTGWDAVAITSATWAAPSDQFAETVVSWPAAISATQGTYLMLRSDASNNCYMAGYRQSAGGWIIGKVTANNLVNLTTAVAYAPQTGDTKKVRFKAVGNVLTLYVDDVQVLTYTDSASPFTAGQPGLASNGGTTVTSGAVTTGFVVDYFKAGAAT